LRGQLGVPDKLNAVLSEPELLWDLRNMLRQEHLITDDAPDPLPPDWFRSWAHLEVEEGAGPLRHIDIVLRGNDPERLRRVAPVVAECVYLGLGKYHDLRPGGRGPRPWIDFETSWEPPADAAAPRRR